MKGIEAAQALAKLDRSVKINLLFVSSFEHARLCIESAQPAAITFACNAVRGVSATPEDFIVLKRRQVSSQSQQLCDVAAATSHYLPDRPPCDWVHELETIAAYLHLNKCKTQLVAMDLCGVRISHSGSHRQNY